MCVSIFTGVERATVFGEHAWPVELVGWVPNHEPFAIRAVPFFVRHPDETLGLLAGQDKQAQGASTTRLAAGGGGRGVKPPFFKA